MENLENKVKYYGLVKQERKDAILIAANEIGGLEINLLGLEGPDIEVSRSTIIESIAAFRLNNNVSTQNEPHDNSLFDNEKAHVISQFDKGFIPLELVADDLHTLTCFWRKVGEIGIKN